MRHPVGHTSNALDVPENRFNNLTFHDSAQHLHFQTTDVFDSGENSLYGAPDNVTVTMDGGYGNGFVQNTTNGAQYDISYTAPSLMSYLHASDSSYPAFHQISSHSTQLYPGFSAEPQLIDALGQTNMGAQIGNVENGARSLSGSSWGVISARPSTSTTPNRDKTSESEYEIVSHAESLRSQATSHSPFQRTEAPSQDLSPVALPEQPQLKTIIEDKSISRSKRPKIASSFSQRASKSKVCKRKGKMSEEGRAKAADMRKNGPCIRCRLYKLGCDGNNPCTRCLKVTHSARSFLEPCSRANLDAVSLVRHSNGRFNQLDVCFRTYRWISVDGKCPSMEIRWNLPGSTPIEGSILPVLFRTYRPEPTDDFDTTTYHWQVNGQARKIVLPPFAVYDTGALLEDVEKFLRDNQPEIETWVTNKSNDDRLAALTYKEALRYRSQPGSDIIKMAIQMQCGAVMSQGYGSVTDPHVLRLPNVDYRHFGRCGYEAYDRDVDCPVPQAMGHQFDVAILKYINRLQKDLIKELRKKIFQPGIKPWYELFLTFFILLSNLEYIHGGALGYLNSKRKTMLESQVSYVVKSQVKEWEFSAGVMLQHFRCVLRGFLPFQLARENLEELREQAKLDEASVEYVSNIIKILEDQRELFLEDYSVDASSEGSIARRWIRQLFMESYG